MESAWAEFMFNDPLADLYYPFAHTTYADCVMVADSSDEPGRLVARSCMVTFADTADELPDDGWDAAVRKGWLTKEKGLVANRVSALEITVRKDLLGGGLSGLMLAAMRGNAATMGFTELLAPVRPNQKHLEPHTPMAEYAFRTRDDGLPYDAWLRVHVRAGATIVKVAPRSMTVSGTLEEWRGWTGLPFDTSGPMEVPKALTPVHVDVEHDHAVYVEPNVWVSHPLT